MTVEIDELAVWLPGRGIALGPLSLTLSGLCVVTGRSGSGGSTLAAALAGTLPRGALVRGSWSPDLIVHHVDGTRAATPGRSAVDVLLGTARSASTDHRAGRRVLLVLDQPLAHVAAHRRAELVRTLRDCADAGIDVCWMEHDLDLAVPAADQVVELLGGSDAVVHPPQEWTPRTLPLPPSPSLARLLGLPRQQWWDLDVISQHAAVRHAVPRDTGRGPELSSASVPVPPARSTLPVEVDVRPGETLGIVPAEGAEAMDRAVEVARRLAASVDGEPRPRPAWAWPTSGQLHQLAASWCRTYGGDPAEALALATEVAAVDPRRTLSQHSTGERRVVEWALAAVSSRTEVLDRPEVGLDAHARRTLARHLREGRNAATLVVSRDPELLVRACHRLLVLQPSDGSADPALGPPASVADHLSDLPLLRRAGSRALRVSDVERDLR